VNIGDSFRTMKRIMTVLGRNISEKTYRSFTGFARELLSFYALFCWALILIALALMISGCGRYKEELESANQQIEKLNSEVKRLTEEVARLNEEKKRLNDDSKALSDKTTRMQRELDDLNKAKAALSAENKEIKKKNSVADEEIATLNREKAQLAKEVEELKKRLAEMASPPRLPDATPIQGGPQSAGPPDEISPCDAVVAFMKASEAIVRQQKGPERTRSLEQAHEQYAPKMKGAPEKAIRAAQEWVKEGTRFWDQPHDDSTFRLLHLRNTVLEFCGKSPSGAGFR